MAGFEVTTHGRFWVTAEGIIRNECGDLIGTVSAGEVKAVIAELSKDDVICRATCSGCG